MKNFRPLMAMFMLLLVTLPSLSLSMHFCGGELNNVTLLAIDHSCGMEPQTPVPPCHEPAADADALPCCQDQPVLDETPDQITHSAQITLSAPDFTFLSSVFAVWLGLPHPADILSARYHNYSPPLIERDIPVLVQSFRI
jgi:hypothetical protein